MKKIIYYQDELSDDFANTKIKRKPLGKNFKYIHKNPIWNFLAVILYYFFAAPLVFLIQKLFSHQKFKNKNVLKKYKKSGYFIFSNHTNYLNDAFIGPLFSLPKKCYVIVNPDATSIKGLRHIVQMLGAIPLGSTFNETKEMVNCIQTRINQKSSVMIYPEAHIWPYYTKIRNFTYQSFKYPAKLNVPVFCITNCYQKRKFFKKPKIVSYVDGPFFPNNELSLNESALDLRNKVYDTMCARSKEYSTYEYIKYIKK